jgi:hypothetical protein
MTTSPASIASRAPNPRHKLAAFVDKCATPQINSFRGRMGLVMVQFDRNHAAWQFLGIGSSGNPQLII